MLRYPTTPRSLKVVRSKSPEETMIQDDSGEVIGIRGGVAKLAETMKGQYGFLGQGNSKNTVRRDIQRSSSATRSGISWNRDSDVGKQRIPSYVPTPTVRTSRLESTINRRSSQASKMSANDVRIGENRSKSIYNYSHENHNQLIKIEPRKTLPSVNQDYPRRIPERKSSITSTGMKSINLFKEDDNKSDEFTENQISVHDLLSIFDRNKNTRKGTQKKDLLNEVSKDKQHFGFMPKGINQESKISRLNAKETPTSRSFREWKPARNKEDEFMCVNKPRIKAPGEENSNMNNVEEEEVTTTESWEEVHVVPFQSAPDELCSKRLVKNQTWHKDNNLAEILAEYQRKGIVPEDDNDTFLYPIRRGGLLIENTIDMTSAPRTIDIVSGDNTIVESNDNPYQTSYYITKENPIYTNNLDWQDTVGKNRFNNFI